MTAPSSSPAVVACPRPDDRLDALRRFVAEHGRPPRRRAVSSGERSLAEWMARQAGRRGMAVVLQRIITGQNRPAAPARRRAPEPAAAPAPPPVRPRRPAVRRRPEPVPVNGVRVPTAPVEQVAAAVEAGRPEAPAPRELSPVQWLRELQRFADTFRRLPDADALDAQERELAVWMLRERSRGNQFVSVAIAARGL